MPITVEINLNGLHVFRTKHKDTIFIALPKDAWRAIDGGCCCRYCSNDPKKSEAAFWDTLAIAANKTDRDFTHTVHFPELHGQRAKRTE